MKKRAVIVKRENVIIGENKHRLYLERDYMLTGLHDALNAQDDKEIENCKERLKEIQEELDMIASCERLLDKHRLT